MPQLAPETAADFFLTDGGLETSLIFLQGIDLPEFAAFRLVETTDGRAALRRYYAPYVDLARRERRGLVLDTPTWRASADWGASLGYEAAQVAAVNRQAVTFVAEIAAECPDVVTVLNGVIGPRGDGYVTGSEMTLEESAEFHSLQARAFAGAGADMVTAVTMTYPEEAAGVALAARAAGLPAAIGVTVETDGRLPTGMPLAEAVAAVESLSGGSPAYLMLNCAHPSHLEAGLVAGAPWLQRIKAIRANASRLSHAELDESETVERGDVAELAGDYVRLRELLTDLRVVGGCCGTDDEHVAAIAAALSTVGR
ncbi:homocysteine methyltransferase [Phycicoccus sp. CMS6Z-2]|nr:homocysteine methyltransferase [Phycicoccus flavus]